MKRATPILAILILLLSIPTALAQSGKLTIVTWVVGSGGESRGSQYTIVGVAGQPDAIEVLQNNRYTLAGGFWSMVGNLIGTGNNRTLYLPLIERRLAPTPIITPIPPPPQKQWHRFGNPGLDLSSLAITSEQMFTGDRKAGGLYRGALATCVSGATLNRVLDRKVFDIVFQGNQGALADFDTTVHYSGDAGNTWAATTSDVENPLAVGIAGGNTFYAGTASKGIYISRNGGATWDSLNSQPKDINALVLNANTLWVGTEGTGVFIFVTGSSQPEERNNGLGIEGKKVWDFAFDTSNNIYIATFDGVYKSTISANQWQPFGLQGVQLYSLEFVDGQLYAGARDPNNKGTQAGVRRRSLTGGDWQEVSSPGWDTTSTVRDLLNEPTFCKGLLAATDDGVWVYR